jgi:ribosomal protein L32
VTLAWAMLAHRRFAVPRVRTARRRRNQRAAAIPDTRLRAAALSALEDKSGNVEAVGVFALLAPRRWRSVALEAIAALQAAIDYLDTLEEAGFDGSQPPDGGYLTGLEEESRRAAASLPSYSVVDPLVQRATARCKEGQRRTHVAAGGDRGMLRAWVSGLNAPPDYRWWEVAAGASSSVAAHALIAAAADPRTQRDEAERIDAAYFPPTGALTVLLDDLVDRQADRAAGEHSYLDYYSRPGEAAERLALLLEHAHASIAGLRRRRLHAAILAGIVAYYLASPAARDDYAGQIRKRMLEAGGGRERLAIAAVRAQRRG